MQLLRPGRGDLSRVAAVVLDRRFDGALGVRPDAAGDGVTVRHTPGQMWWRNVVPRLPALLFSLVFMSLAYVACRQMGGRAAGWTALTFAVFARSSIDYGAQARYYSATLMLAMACGLVIWRAMRIGRWRDFLLMGILLALMFHTHILSCAVLSGVACLGLPLVRRDRLVPKSLAAGAILASASLPWLILTGFLGHADGLPKAWRLLTLPGDLWELLAEKVVFLMLASAGIALLLATIAFRDQLPTRLVRSFAGRGGAYTFLAVWAAVSLLCFIFLIPAASYFSGRLWLMLAAPCTLLLALVLGGLAEVVAPRLAVVLAPAAAVALMAAIDQFPPRCSTMFATPGPLMALVDHLRASGLEEGTRIYSTPNDHLSLAYFTGLPVQSIAPVRESFLEAYPGPVVIIDRQVEFGVGLPWREVQTLARRAGHEHSEEEARRLARRLQLDPLLRGLAGRGVRVDPPPEPLPAYLTPALAELARRRDTRRVQAQTQARSQNLAMFRDFTIRDWSDWWQVFFYRFVDPASRMGEHLNYAGRIRGARAVILAEAGCIVYHSPPQRTTTPPGRGALGPGARHRTGGACGRPHSHACRPARMEARVPRKSEINTL